MMWGEWKDELIYLISWFKKNDIFAEIDVVNIGFNIKTQPFRCDKPEEYSTITCITGETSHVIEWIYNEIIDDHSYSFSFPHVVEVIAREQGNRIY